MKVKPHSVFAVLILEVVFTFHSTAPGPRLTWQKRGQGSNTLDCLAGCCHHCEQLTVFLSQQNGPDVVHIIVASLSGEVGWQPSTVFRFFRKRLVPHSSQLNQSQLNSSVMWWVRLETDREVFVSSNEEMNWWGMTQDSLNSQTQTTSPGWIFSVGF